MSLWRSFLTTGAALAAPATNKRIQTTASRSLVSRLLGGVTVVSLLAVSAAFGPTQAQELTLQASPEQEKGIGAWTASLAMQAATYGAPIVAMYNLRSTVAVGPNPKAPPGHIWRQEDISTPKIAAESGYVSPNVDVVYGFGFADLGQEPVILTAPNSGDRYYMIEVVDMYTHAFAYPAGGELRLQGRQVRVRWPRLARRTAAGRHSHRRADALDRISAARERQERNRSAGGPEGAESHHLAGAVAVQRRPGSGASSLRLRSSEDDAGRGHQPHAV